LYQDFLWVWLL